MKLLGKHIYLRSLELQDANGSYPNWFNDKEVCKYNSHGDTLYTKEMALNYIENIKNSSNIVVFAICDNKSNKHIGNISLQQISKQDHSAEFAIIMGEKEFWGRGLAKEASKLIIEYGFNTLKLSRIYCGTSEANVAMQKLAFTLGMRFKERLEKSFKKNNDLFDIVKYELLRNGFTV